MQDRIHITGASGSGTTRLGHEISARHGHAHLDSDDFFWEPTDPPYMQPRPPEERLRLLRKEMAPLDRWVLSGSLAGWGDPLIPQFDLVIFLTVPTDIRLARLRAREKERHGLNAISPSGQLHDSSAAFLDWAARYDEGGLDMRSRARHEQWLQRLEMPVLRLDGDRPVAVQVAVGGGFRCRGMTRLGRRPASPIVMRRWHMRRLRPPLVCAQSWRDHK